MTESKIEKTEAPKKSKENPNKGHRIRLKQRFRNVGFKGLHDVEKLELLLFFAIPQKDTKPTARELISRFGSIARVFEATEDQLLQVAGVTPNAAILLKMMLPLFEEYQKIKVNFDKIQRPDDCGRKLCDYFKGKTVETVAVVCVDSACKVIAIEDVCEGDAVSVLINCRRLVEIVLKYSKTAAVILSHNHPGGFALPSREDISSTVDIIRTLRSMGINVVDHLIIADNDFISLAQSDQFANIFR